MDDRKDAARPGFQPKSRRIPADGIIGRLTYTPAHDHEGIGQIRRNQAKDESEHWSPECCLFLPLC
jgi:RNA polymerase I-specific transcription initiation factor RRN6